MLFVEYKWHEISILISPYKML